MNDPHRTPANGAVHTPETLAPAGGILSWVWRNKIILAGLILALAGGLTLLTAKESPPIWTASSLVKIGKIPRLSVLVGDSRDLTEPVEDVREALLRINDPTFQTAVLDAATAKVKADKSSEAAFQANLRGEAVSGDVVRLESVGGSEAAVRAMLESAISKLRDVHAEIGAQRVLQLDQAAAQIRAAQQVPPNPTTDQSHSFFDSNLSGIIDGAKYAAESTRIMYGTEITIAGPSAGSRSRAQVFAALGMLIAAAVLTWAAIGGGRKEPPVGS